MTLTEMKRIYIGLSVAEDGFCYSRLKYDKKGNGCRVYVGDSWYHMDFYRTIDDIGGPVTDLLIEAIEDSMSWSEFQTVIERKNRIRRENDIPDGWLLMSDWVGTSRAKNT